MDLEARAAAALALKRTKQAAGALRKATHLLAPASRETAMFGSVEVRGESDLDGACELVALALAEHGRVDVVLLIDGEPTHQGAYNGAKEDVHR